MIEIFATILVTSDVVIEGCGINSSSAAVDVIGLIKPKVWDSIILKSSLHNSLKSLHSLSSAIIEFCHGSFSKK